MNNSVQELNNIFKLAEERISELDDRLIQVMQPKNRRKGGRKMSRTSEKCGTPLSDQKTKKGVEKYSQK